MLRAVSEGGRRKAFMGQVRGLVHWGRSEITGYLVEIPLLLTYSYMFILILTSVVILQ